MTTGTEPSPSPPAAPPDGIAEYVDEGVIALVTDYEAFAWNQTFTLVEPLPAPVFLDLLNVIIERELDPEIRLRAMRMAAGVAEWVHDKFMRTHFGYDAPEGCPESEAASRDPHEVARHLLLSSSLALDVGDPQFPCLAAGWLGVGSGVARLEAYLDVIESPQTVVRIVQKETPAAYLRAIVYGRVEDAERLRPQTARGRRVLSIDHERWRDAVAECGTDAAPPFIDNLLEALRARPGKKAKRLTSIIERVHEGYGKAQLGRADYQYLYDSVPMLARLAVDRAATGQTRSAWTQPWFYERILGVPHVTHRYRGQELEIYGTLVRRAFETLTNSSADLLGSVAGK